MPVITNAGEYLITQQQQAGEALIIDQMILANITGLDSNTVPSRDQSMPAPADVKIIKPITKDGLLNTNTVVYSTVFPSTDGTFDFNYMGLYSSAHDVIVAVAYVPLQTKIKTVGTDVGNVITKNFAIEFTAAADITGINISAESWQIDYTARLMSMDKHQRDLVKNIYGPSTFLNDAFKVKFETDKYYLTAGKAILGGINFDLETDLEIVPGTLPQTVWLDVYQETSMMGVLNKHDVVFNDGTVLTDYVAGSVEHTLVKLGVVNSSVDIVDGRSLVKRSLELTTKNNDPKNIAELRKYRPEYAGQKLDIDGHTLPGVGGGPFYHDPDDSTSPDNNGTVIVNEWGDVWKKFVLGGTQNPNMYGVLSTDADASMGINSSISSGFSNFDGGTYNASELVLINEGKHLSGSDGQQGGTLNTDKGIEVEGAYSSIKNIRINTDTSPEFGINVVENDSYGDFGNEILNTRVTGLKGIKIGGYETKLEGLYLTGLGNEISGGVGVEITQWDTSIDNVLMQEYENGVISNKGLQANDLHVVRCDRGITLSQQGGPVQLTNTFIDTPAEFGVRGFDQSAMQFTNTFFLKVGSEGKAATSAAIFLDDNSSENTFISSQFIQPDITTVDNMIKLQNGSIDNLFFGNRGQCQMKDELYRERLRKSTLIGGMGPWARYNNIPRKSRVKASGVAAAASATLEFHLDFTHDNLDSNNSYLFYGKYISRTTLSEASFGDVYIPISFDDYGMSPVLNKISGSSNSSWSVVSSALDGNKLTLVVQNDSTNPASISMEIERSVDNRAKAF